MVVERLWAPSVKDAATQMAPRSFFARAQTSSLTTVVNVGFGGSGGSNLGEQFDQDHVLIATHILAVASAGSGQNVTDMIVNLTDDLAVSNFCGIINTHDSANPGTERILSTHWEGNVVLFQRDQLLLTAVYNSGVASNSASLSVAGYVVPRGNFQR